jgi:hypothetical protein
MRQGYAECKAGAAPRASTIIQSLLAADRLDGSGRTGNQVIDRVLVTTEAMVAEKPEKKPAAPMPPGGMGDDF